MLNIVHIPCIKDVTNATKCTYNTVIRALSVNMLELRSAHTKFLSTCRYDFWSCEMQQLQVIRAMVSPWFFVPAKKHHASVLGTWTLIMAQMSRNYEACSSLLYKVGSPFEIRTVVPIFSRLWLVEHLEWTYHVIRGNVHTTSWRVGVRDWTEVRWGATAKYVVIWPLWWGLRGL